MPAGESGIADAFGGEKFVVAGNDQAVGVDGVGGFVVAIERRLEVVEATIFFGEAAVIIEAQPAGERQIGANLEFVLHEESGFLGTVVAIGVAL